MRALALAFALLFAAGAAAPQASPSLERPRTALERAPAAFVLLAAKIVAAKRCGSRGGVRRSRSTYTATCA